MKLKLFLLSLITIVTISANAQDTAIKKVVDTSKVTFSTVYSDVKEGLKGLGSALKVGSEHVYSVLVKQQLIYALSWLLVFLAGLIGFIYAITLISKADFDEGEWKAVVGPILGVITLIISIVSVCHGDVILGGLINPEYGALHDIMDFIKR